MKYHLIVIAALTIYIFRHAARKNSHDKNDNSFHGCAGCGASAFCSDLKKYEAVAEGACKGPEKVNPLKF